MSPIGRGTLYAFAGITAFVGLVLGAVAGGLVGYRMARGTTAAESSPSSDPSIIGLGPGMDPWQDFERNAIDADRKWMGKRIRFAALVVDIGRDRHGYYVAFNPPIEIRLAAGEEAKFATVSKGETIRVEVTLSSYSPGNPIHLKGTDAKFLASERAR